MFSKKENCLRNVLASVVLFANLFFTGGLKTVFAFGSAPVLGNYANASVNTAGSVVVHPSTAPSGVVRATAMTSPNFKGTLAVNPVTGAVRVTNAYPAGNYTITVRAVDAGGTASVSKTFTLSVSPAAGCTGGNFYIPQSFPSVPGNTASRATYLHDLNSDGKNDLITIENDALIAIGNGDGTFGNQVSYTNDFDAPNQIDFADINGDGKLDMVGAGDFGNLLFYIGNGDGTFAAPTLLNLSGSALRSIALSDLNNDGLPEILTAIRISGQSRLIVLFNQGGAFSEPQVIAPSVLVNRIAVGDFNNDGFKDIFIANSSSYVVMNNGNLTFASPQPVPDAAGTTDTKTADLNGDGNLDLILRVTPPVDHPQQYLRVLFGNGNGTFGAPAGYDLEVRPDDFEVRDLNQDNRPEIAIVQRSSTNPGIAVLLNNSDGSFIPMPFLALTAGTSPWTVAAGKIDGDHRVDLAVATTSGIMQPLNSTLILHGNGAAGFDKVPYYLTPGGLTALNRPSAIAAADFNNDGVQDLAVGNQTVFFGFSIFMGRNSESFARPVNLPTFRGVSSIVTADLNGDGNLDLAGGSSSGSVLPVIFGNGDGTFQPRVDYPVGNNPQVIGSGDFNGDGWPDLISVNNVSQNFSVLLNNGDGAFAAAINFPIPIFSIPQKIQISDFNEDGKLDFIHYDIGTLWLGNGDGTFVYGGTPTGEFTGVVADFNNDTHQDVISSNTGGNNFYGGNGNGTFTAGQLLENMPVQVIEAADFDADGNQDFISAGSLRLRFGNGNGTFQTAIPYSWDSAAFMVGDFNHDGKLDFAANHASEQKFAVFLQECTVNFSRTTLPNGSLNQNYNQTINLSGGTVPYNISVSGLPAGLSYSSSGNAITFSGTPTVTGQFNVRVSVTDSTPLAESSKSAAPTAANQAFQVIPLQIFAPTAAAVSISGRVATAGGAGIRNVIVTLTDARGTIRTTVTGTFGTYRFTDVVVGETYVLTVTSKRYVFANPSQVVPVSEELANLDFIAGEQ